MSSVDKAIRISEREGLCSVSNNTKWRGLLSEIRGLPTNKRIKWIDNEEPTAWQVGLWQPTPTYVEALGGPEQLKFVEWIEIARTEQRYVGRLVDAESIDHTETILRALGSAGMNFEELDDSFRIFGYTRPESNRKRAEQDVPPKSDRAGG